MRGRRQAQATMLAFVELEERVSRRPPAAGHQALCDRGLAELSRVIDEMYAAGGRGVVLMLTSGSGQELTRPSSGQWAARGPADAAIESLMRYLASEVALEADQPVPGDPPAPGVEAALDALVGVSMLRKRPTLQEVADTAAFLASDRASGITASIVNVTSGISSALAL
jgi:NAD(P)-dependent dehydrogenase (short-subunit alcohol dehydrogenase family)